MNMALSDIQKHLFEIRSDADYRVLQQKIIPNVDPELIIGIRTPVIREYAKELRKSGGYAEFIEKLPHQYFEEYMLHVMILNDEKDYETAIRETERLLPYINNWAVCDQFVPKVFKKHTDDLLEHIRVWLDSDLEYTIRYGMKMLMSFYLDEGFKPEYMDMVASSDRTDLTYVSLMTAWYFATALAKQYDAAVKVIEAKRLEKKTHNKAIQKAVESFRITDEQKKYLKTLKY
ncbi:MAG: DNA alkylation repair protein [Saccharofermentans sp.]|jgi:3-methyladenine DNA glycosylase AlkD|nr:DNA alkylation repair protein [Saccharofermentans sp.]